LEEQYHSREQQQESKVEPYQRLQDLPGKVQDKQHDCSQQEDHRHGLQTSGCRSGPAVLVVDFRASRHLGDVLRGNPLPVVPPGSLAV
jgi:hypothetical protein